MESQSPTPRLLDQVRSLMRLHHYSIHTERSSNQAGFVPTTLLTPRFNAPQLSFTLDGRCPTSPVKLELKKSKIMKDHPSIQHTARDSASCNNVTMQQCNDPLPSPQPPIQESNNPSIQSVANPSIQPGANSSSHSPQQSTNPVIHQSIWRLASL